MATVFKTKKMFTVTIRKHKIKELKMGGDFS